MDFSGFYIMARMLLITLCMTGMVAQASTLDREGEMQPLLNTISPQEFEMTAQLAHQLIGEQQADLLGDGTQLVSLYYFGQNNNTSVVGLERVGDDYLPIRWLLVFEEERLLGWYYPVGEFPARFNEGHLTFPKGTSDEDIFLFPAPPKVMKIEGTDIPFITPSTGMTSDDSGFQIKQISP